MTIFHFLREIRKKIYIALADNPHLDQIKLNIYTQDQENAVYPCVLIKIKSIIPGFTAMPSYDLSFSIHIIGNKHTYSLTAPEYILNALTLNSISSQNKILTNLRDTKGSYQLMYLSHMGTYWEVGEDRFSIDTRMDYICNVVFEAVQEQDHINKPNNNNSIY